MRNDRLQMARQMERQTEKLKSSTSALVNYLLRPKPTALQSQVKNSALLYGKNQVTNDRLQMARQMDRQTEKPKELHQCPSKLSPEAQTYIPSISRQELCAPLWKKSNDRLQMARQMDRQTEKLKSSTSALVNYLLRPKPTALQSQVKNSALLYGRNQVTNDRLQMARQMDRQTEKLKSSTSALVNYLLRLKPTALQSQVKNSALLFGRNQMTNDRLQMARQMDRQTEKLKSSTSALVNYLLRPKPTALQSQVKNSALLYGRNQMTNDRLQMARQMDRQTEKLKSSTSALVNYLLRLKPTALQSQVKNSALLYGRNQMTNGRWLDRWTDRLKN